tara:strand:+ start:566 stop:997 length:432 start_codon:yes stop_codon:yes gene_type:complete
MKRSAREIDIDPRTYVGLSFPLRADNNNSFAMTKNSVQQAQYNLKNLLLTSLGERPMLPEFGCRLREVCFEQQDTELPNKVKEIIEEAVSNWLPYINISDIDVSTKAGDKSTIFVTVSFSTTLNPDTLEQITLDTSYASNFKP